MEKTQVPDKVEVMSTLMLYAMETNVLLNVMCDVLIGIRTKDMTDEEKKTYNERINASLKDYREKAKTFLIAAK
jgi:hypothetical protein